MRLSTSIFGASRKEKAAILHCTLMKNEVDRISWTSFAWSKLRRNIEDRYFWSFMFLRHCEKYPDSIPGSYRRSEETGMLTKSRSFNEDTFNLAASEFNVA